MNSKIVVKMGLLLLTVMWLATACHEDDHYDAGRPDTYRVAVFMPGDEQPRLKEIAEWAVRNIGESQHGLPHQVSLSLEWYDENAPDWEVSAQKVSEDHGVVAVIGPKSSVKAGKMAELCKKHDKTLILPVSTSTELQRRLAGSRYVWNLSQSDITQCELLLTQAWLYRISEVSLIASSDDYGRSFSDWMAFQATELGLSVGDIVIYHSEEELRQAVRNEHAKTNKFDKVVLFAPGKTDDVLAFDDEIGRLMEKDSKHFSFPLLLCSDMVNSISLRGKLKYPRYEGISPSATPESGFNNIYRIKFGREPLCGEAHFFDALALLAFSLAHNHAYGTDDLDQSILAIVDGRGKRTGSCLMTDLYNIFSSISARTELDLEGVTGDWTFDARSYASVLNTTYCHWIIHNGNYETLEYVSTDGGMNTISTSQAWEWESSKLQSFDANQTDYQYPEQKDRWAVVVGASDDWANYRHQADALAMYQVLKRHGYDDNHIILITEDNIAYHPKNIHPGTVKIRPEGENVYENVTIDYKLSDLSFNDFMNVLQGKKSERLPKVVSSTGNDNVLISWCGHGYPGMLAWGSNDYVYGNQIRQAVEGMNYRKLFFVLDACYSGTIGEACEGVPGMLVMTSANPAEPSKADMMDPEMGIWLSNGFTRAFQEITDVEPNISMRDMYYKLAGQTTGSHVTVYNWAYYGNMYRNSMGEYLN